MIEAVAILVSILLFISFIICPAILAGYTASLKMPKSDKDEWKMYIGHNVQETAHIRVHAVI